LPQRAHRPRRQQEGPPHRLLHDKGAVANQAGPRLLQRRRVHGPEDRRQVLPRVFRPHQRQCRKRLPASHARRAGPTAEEKEKQEREKKGKESKGKESKGKETKTKKEKTESYEEEKKEKKEKRKQQKMNQQKR